MTEGFVLNRAKIKLVRILLKRWGNLWRRLFKQALQAEADTYVDWDATSQRRGRGMFTQIEIRLQDQAYGGRGFVQAVWFRRFSVRAVQLAKPFVRFGSYRFAATAVHPVDGSFLFG